MYFDQLVKTVGLYFVTCQDCGIVFCRFSNVFHYDVSSAESQKGFTAVQCSIENQKGVVTRLCTAIAPFWFSMKHLWTALTPFLLSTNGMCVVCLSGCLHWVWREPGEEQSARRSQVVCHRLPGAHQCTGLTMVSWQELHVDTASLGHRHHSPVYTQPGQLGFSFRLQHAA